MRITQLPTFPLHAVSDPVDSRLFTILDADNYVVAETHREDFATLIVTLINASPVAALAEPDNPLLDEQYKALGMTIPHAQRSKKPKVPKNPAPLTDQQKHDLAERAFIEFDFGDDAIGETDGWEHFQGSNTLTRKIYLEPYGIKPNSGQAGDFPSRQVSFNVTIYEEKETVRAECDGMETIVHFKQLTK